MTKPAVDHKAHQDKVEKAVTANNPRERFRQAILAMKANYEALPSLEAKDAAVQDAFAKLDEIEVGIFVRTD